MEVAAWRHHEYNLARELFDEGTSGGPISAQTSVCSSELCDHHVLDRGRASSVSLCGFCLLAGMTIMARPPMSKGIEELKREDYAEGRIVLSQKLEEFAPHVVAFNGKLTYEQFGQRKCKFGIQKELLYGARVYVLPSTSGANATGRSEKLRHFRKLAQLVARICKEHEAKAH